MVDLPDGRLGRAEADIKDLLREIGAYRSEVLQWRLDLAKDFMTRREADATQAMNYARLDRVEQRLTETNDQAGSRGWQVALALLVSLISVIIAAVGWFRPLH